MLIFFLMKILITGGAGFIGSHLLDSLLDKNFEISIIDNLSLGKIANIEHHLSNNRLKFTQLDINDVEEIDLFFSNNNFDVIFHLAANSDIAVSHEKPQVDLHNTFLTTFNILEMMRIHNIKNIVFASTSAIYGDSDKELIENYGPLFPVSHYGASKLASEAFISSYCENYGFKSWIIRFPNVIGERSTHGVIYDFLRKAQRDDIDYLEVLGNGEQNKPYVYVKDLVRAIIYVWENSNERLNYFNVGVDTSTKVSKIAQIVLEELKSDKKIIYTGGDRGWIGDVPTFKYCLNKIHDLGWKASYSSDEAVRISVRNSINLNLLNLNK